MKGQEKMNKRKKLQNVFEPILCFFIFFFYHMDHDYHLSSFLLYAAAGSTLTQVYSTRGWRGDLWHALKIVFEFQNVFKKYVDFKKPSMYLVNCYCLATKYIN